MNIRSMNIRSIAACALFICSVLPSTVRSEIILDFSQDTNNFFGNATARAAIDAAVADINSQILFNFGAVTDTTVGAALGTQITWDFRYNYTHPSTGDPQTIADTTLPANEIRVFVGSQLLPGTILGQGGPGVTNASFSVSPFNGSGTIAPAIAAGVAADTHRRGDGPIINRVSGVIGGVPYSFDAGLAVGNLWFDTDTNWHFDHTTPVAAGTFDLYTVALHETLHAIGYGLGVSWNDQVSGSDWLGSELIAAHGTGVGLVDGSGSHLASSLMSARVSDGVMQNVVMSPTLASGVRKELTQYDLAVLRDIGFSTVSAIPEPSSVVLLSIATCGMLLSRRRNAA